MVLFTLYVGDECATVRDLHLSVLAILNSVQQKKNMHIINFMFV